MRMQTALHAVFPPECLGCGTLVDSDFALCPGCWADTPFIHGTICDSCGTPLPGTATDGETLHCDGCRAAPRAWSQGRAVMEYGGVARRLVLGLKHSDRAEVARAAGPWLARQSVDILGPDSIIVPIPLHRWRLLRRRYNQSALLAHALARATDVDVAVDALERDRPTESLEGKSRSERTDILQSAIRPHATRGSQLAGRDVVLIDDVLTSGATFEAATHAAFAAGAKNVSVMALARAVWDA